MGKLVKGRWTDQWYDTKKTDGAFERENTQLHDRITPDTRSKFPAEANRYHLYVSHACPWAHRTLIFRKLKQLEPLISVSVVSPYMLKDGWTFNVAEGSTGDELYQKKYLHEIYTQHDNKYTGRVTVPVLWDKKTHCIVNNESAEIIRMFNHAFDALTGNQEDYYPKALQTDIDTLNDYVYKNINNGVYRCGFATQQNAYETAYTELFTALDKIENILSQQRYLVGEQLTEADWRLFTTLIRFDSVYHGHFKCNRQPIESFPNLSKYLRKLYQWPGIADTVHFDHIKRHYYYSHTTINPTQIVPLGPEIDYSRPDTKTKRDAK